MTLLTTQGWKYVTCYENQIYYSLANGLQDKLANCYALTMYPTNDTVKIWVIIVSSYGFIDSSLCVHKRTHMHKWNFKKIQYLENEF